MSDPRIKTIRIKSGIVRRITKEIGSYGREADKQRLKIEKMRSLDTDDYNIKKQEEVLQESLMMIPDGRKRLAVANAELKGILETEQDLVEVEEYQLAQALVSEAELLLAN